ncbi:MAG TPA: DUF4190 domain-containing protein [Chthoniobacterales bacterium]|nr:DUF4190 domain-containing protein [Chthoniobacterales bacterium]
MADQPPSLPQTSSALPPSRTEPLAIWSLVLAILSWFFCLLLGSIPAIVCGHLARSRIRRAKEALQGMNFALAALIIAYLEIPFGVLGGIMLVDMLRSDRVRLHDLAGQKKEIASDDGKLNVTTSGFWVKKSDLNKEAKLQLAQQHHRITREHMLKQMTNSSATESASMTIDNHPALQDELSGTERGKNVVFLHTTVDEGDSFQQILACPLKWRWQKENEELRDATTSFHAEK